MNFIKNLFKRINIIALILFLPLFSVSAECADKTKVCNPIGATDINGLIKDILIGVIKISIPVIALAVIYSGFLFVSARGSTETLDKAKKTLLYTLIGSALLLGSWAIAQLISNTVLALQI